MCDIMWLTRMEIEYKERIKSLIIGQFPVKLFLKIISPMNSILLVFQLLYYFNVTFRQCYFAQDFIIQAMLFNVIMLTLVITVTILNYCMEGSRLFYRNSLYKLRAAKANNQDVNYLRAELRRGKMINIGCIKDIARRNYKTILFLIVIVAIQNFLWFNI